MSMEHIRVVESADLLLIAPATAGIIGKMANGMADDALSNLCVSYNGTIMVAPAMNDDMYANLAVKANIKKMKRRGVEFIEPEEGELACGSIGQGRLAEPLNLLEAVKKRLNPINDFYELRILVTAGICFISCRTASEMNDRVLQIFSDCDVLIMSAAVGDFAPKQIEKEKIKKKGDAPLTLKLLPTEDILKNVTARKIRQFESCSPRSDPLFFWFLDPEPSKK